MSPRDKYNLIEIQMKGIANKIEEDTKAKQKELDRIRADMLLIKTMILETMGKAGTSRDRY